MTTETKKYRTILSIAGSDSSGGAGIQADIKTANSMGVFAMTAISALTAQNTTGVQAIHTPGDDFLKAQIESVCTDERPDAVKIGMLPTAETVKCVADEIRAQSLGNVVVDPVLVATSGANLTTEQTAATAMSTYLFPLATLITPNIPEAEHFLGRKITDPEADCRILGEMFNVSVLLKGGHSNGNEATDYLFDISDGKVTPYTLPRIASENTHGTGCSLSTAIASLLAKERSLKDAVRGAKLVVAREIEYGKDYRFGHGHGPLYFFLDNSEI